MTHNTKKPKPPRTRPAYKITITGGEFVIQSPLGGWIEADVTFDGQTKQVRAEIVNEPDFINLQLHADLPDWLANIVVENLVRHWRKFRDHTMDGLLDGSIVPQKPS